MKVAVIGATGLVGNEMLRVLEERAFPVTQLIPVASDQSVGKELIFAGKSWKLHAIADAVALKPDLVLFAAGNDISLEFVPQFAATGSLVVDNSSAWRMDANTPLVVPEVNLDAIGNSRIIANPNCTTIQLVLVIAPLAKAFGLERVVVSTYQSVTGTGIAAMERLEAERSGIKDGVSPYPHPIDHNCIPQCDDFAEDGHTKEEWKVMQESRKIMSMPILPITCTAVRVPVLGGHSESVNLTLSKDCTRKELIEVLEAVPGIVIQDEPEKGLYPMPIYSRGKDEVFVGRIRRDFSAPNSWNLWIVADNLRKGAATNAVQIAQHVLQAQGQLS